IQARGPPAPLWARPTARGGVKPAGRGAGGRGASRSAARPPPRRRSRAPPAGPPGHHPASPPAARNPAVAWPAARRRARREAGGLMAYGADLRATLRGVATYVVKILKGAKPGDLPIEQATAFDFLINLKTARELGLAIPPAVLQQASEVIQ